MSKKYKYISNSDAIMGGVTEISKKHEHLWQEQRTYLKGNNDGKYALSRYCKECGQCEIYIPKENKWVIAGNIND